MLSVILLWWHVIAASVSSHSYNNTQTDSQWTNQELVAFLRGYNHLYFAFCGHVRQIFAGKFTGRIKSIGSYCTLVNE